MRKLNDMFHLEGERLVKTSNGQFVPEDEPLFIIRGRDAMAVALLSAYREFCRDHGTPQQRIDDLASVINLFEDYQKNYPDKMKIPGITLGK